MLAISNRFICKMQKQMWNYIINKWTWRKCRKKARIHGFQKDLMCMYPRTSRVLRDGGFWHRNLDEGVWSGSLNPDTSLDLLPCGLPVIRLPLTLPPGKHHSHPRPSHHLPTHLSPPSLILISSSALSVCLRTPTNCFIYSPDCWYLTWAAESFCVPASQRNPAATFQHHHLPRDNFRRSQQNVTGRCSTNKVKRDTLLLGSSYLWGRDLELQKHVRY